MLRVNDSLLSREDQRKCSTNNHFEIIDVPLARWKAPDGTNEAEYLKFLQFAGKQVPNFLWLRKIGFSRF